MEAEFLDPDSLMYAPTPRPDERTYIRWTAGPRCPVTGYEHGQGYVGPWTRERAAEILAAAVARNEDWAGELVTGRGVGGWTGNPFRVIPDEDANAQP